MFSMAALTLAEALCLTLSMALTRQFEQIKVLSYNTVAEKTENRGRYVESLLNQKTALVFETSAAVNGIAENLFKENVTTAAAIETDRALNNELLDKSAELLISLIRRDMVNEAFLILDTAALYDDGQKHNLNAVYIRDTDVNENSATDNADIYLVAGSSEISHKYGLPLDHEWSRYITANGENTEFFTHTLEGYMKSGKNMPVYYYGYWSDFSSVSGGDQQSVKYTLPLIAKNGRVYGAVGIGLLKKTVLSAIPSSDFFDESACYVLATDKTGNGVYEQLLVSGPAQGRLIDQNTVFSRDKEIEYGMFDFTSGRAPCVGSICELNIYNSGSPHKRERWALISAADNDRTLSMYRTITTIFGISIGVTLLAGFFFAGVISRSISRPVSRMVKAVEQGKKDNSPLEFTPSRITEIDDLAAAFSEYRSYAVEYFSRVSRIVTMAGGKIGVFMCDMRNKSVFVGENLIELLGFEDLPAKDVTISFEEFCLHIRKIDVHNKVLGLGIFREQPSCTDVSVEITRDKKDADPAYYNFILKRDNESVIGLVEDITDTVSEKRAIAKGKDVEYNQKLVEANAALSDAYAAAKQANNAKTDFLSRMSHDIRTPMNAIIGMTAIAESSIGDDEKIRDCLAKINSSGLYMLSLINEVLDMSKIEAGKFVLASEAFDIAEFVESVVEIVKPAAREKNHELNINVAGITHKTVVGDETRLKQAFVNILSNAVKYTPEGGLISFLAAEKAISQTKVGCFEFVISDNGVGMSEEYLKKLYDPFERASDDRLSKEAGTGLGMAITKNIIEMMDGDISVESEAGKGTTFTVTICLQIASESAVIEHSEPAAKAISECDFSGRRVLLAEDNELNREIACDILKMTNIEIETAENGKEAADKFAKSEVGYYDMILMDVQMPYMNGYEATAEIRGMRRKDSDLPIVAMTANAFAEDVKASKAAGMNEHIAKPLDLSKLASVMNKWLRR